MAVSAFQKIRFFFRGYFTELMIFLLLLFVFRPNNWNMISIAVWELFFTGVLFSSIFNAHHPKMVKRITISLGIPALIFDWFSLLFPIEILIYTSLCFTIAFLFICTTSILYNVVLRARVTLETLRGAICTYFMIAFAFGFLYLFIEFLYPGSFHLIHEDQIFTLHSSYLSQLFYFSFITLLTIGFGDITPLTDLAQTFVVIEGVIGQFYIAILVARIVSVYALLSDKTMLKQLESEIVHAGGKIKKEKGAED